MKRWIAALVLLAVWLYPARAVADGDGSAQQTLAAQMDSLGARAYCLLERTTGRVLFAWNENERLPMASTTKIMTALLAVENCSMDEMVTASANASGVPGTSIYLQVGETLSMYQMLQGLMLRSGNDAAVAIAEHIDGDTVAFAQRMNRRAQQLGADACFVTPNGLDAEGHGASALAMATIAAAALENDVFREIVSTQRATLPWQGSQYDRVLTNKNRLLKEYEGATGVKTGYTSKAGRCLVFSAQRDGMELVGCVLNCYTWFDSAETLQDEGFAAFAMQTALAPGEEVQQIRVSGGMQSSVGVISEGLCAPVMQHEAWELHLETEQELRAPVQAGQQVGTAYFVLKETGETLAQCALTVVQDVPENSLSNALHSLLRRWTLWEN